MKTSPSTPPPAAAPDIPPARTLIPWPASQTSATIPASPRLLTRQVPPHPFVANPEELTEDWLDVARPEQRWGINE